MPKKKETSPYTKFKGFRRGTYATGTAETILVAFNATTQYWVTIHGTHTDNETEARKVLLRLNTPAILNQPNVSGQPATYEWLGNLDDDSIKAQFARPTQGATS